MEHVDIAKFSEDMDEKLAEVHDLSNRISAAAEVLDGLMQNLDNTELPTIKPGGYGVPRRPCKPTTLTISKEAHNTLGEMTRDWNVSLGSITRYALKAFVGKYGYPTKGILTPNDNVALGRCDRVRKPFTHRREK